MCEPQIATLTEIETYWSICDLFDAHEILDIKEGIQAEKQRQADAKNNKR